MHHLYHSTLLGSRARCTGVSSSERKWCQAMNKICFAVGVFRACTAPDFATVLRSTWVGASTVPSMCSRRTKWLPERR